MKNLNKSYVTGIFFILIGCAIIYGTTLIKVRLVSNEPGPKFFPMIAAIGIIVFSVLTMIFDGGKERRESKASEEAGKTIPPYLTKDGWTRMITFFAEMVIFAIGMKYIGYLFTSCIMTFVITWTLKGKKKVSLIFAIIFSLVISCIVYFSFVKIFNIPLPTGSLWTALGLNMNF